MKADGLISAQKPVPVSVKEISWAQAYERRMRQFNWKIVLAVLSSLTLLVAWFFWA